MSQSLYQKWKKNPNSLSTQEINELASWTRDPQPQAQSQTQSSMPSTASAVDRYQEPDKYKPQSDLYANQKYITPSQKGDINAKIQDSVDSNWEDPKYVSEKKKELYMRYKQDKSSLNLDELNFLAGLKDRIGAKEKVFSDTEKQQFTQDNIKGNYDALETQKESNPQGQSYMYDKKYNLTAFNKDYGYDFFKNDNDNYVIDDQLLQDVKDQGNPEGYLRAVKENFPNKKYVVMPYNGNIIKLPIDTAINISQPGFASAGFNFHMKGLGAITGGLTDGAGKGVLNAVQMSTSPANALNAGIQDITKNGLAWSNFGEAGKAVANSFNTKYAYGQEKPVTFSDNLDNFGWKTDENSSWINRAAHGTTGFLGDVALSLGLGSAGKSVVSVGGKVAKKLGNKTVDEVGDLMGDKIAQKVGMHEGENLAYKQDLISKAKERFVQNGGNLSEKEMDDIISEANSSQIKRDIAKNDYSTTPLDGRIGKLESKLAGTPEKFNAGIENSYSKMYDNFLERAGSRGIAPNDTANLQRLWYAENKSIPFEQIQNLAGKSTDEIRALAKADKSTKAYGIYDDAHLNLPEGTQPINPFNVSNPAYNKLFSKLQELKNDAGQSRVSSIVDDTTRAMENPSGSRQMVGDLFKEGVRSPIIVNDGLKVGLPFLPKVKVLPQSALDKVSEAMGKVADSGVGKAVQSGLKIGINTAPMRAVENGILKPISKLVDLISNKMSVTYGVPLLIRDLMDKANGHVARDTYNAQREMQTLMKDSTVAEKEQLAKHLGGYQNTPLPEKFADKIDQINAYSKRSAERENLTPRDNYIMGAYDEFAKKGKNSSAVNRQFGYKKLEDSISTNVENRNAFAKKYDNPWEARDQLAKEGITLTPESNAGKLLFGREAGSIAKTERKNLLDTLKKLAEDQNPHVRMEGDRVVIQDSKGAVNQKATDQINEFISPVAKERSPVGKIFKGVQDWQKTALMATLPATAMRNIFGGTMMNLTDGTRLSDYAKMLEVMARQSADDGAFRKVSDFFGGKNLGKKFANKEMNIGGEKMTVREWGNKANESGVQNSMFHADIPSTMARFGKMGWKDVAQKFNPLNKDQFIGFDPGKKLLSLGEDLNRGARFNQGVREMGTQGDALSQIGKDVKAVHFDYSPHALTKQEQFVKDYLLPFYTFSRFSTPATLRQMLKEPGMVNGFANNYQKDFQASGDNGHNNPYDPEYNKHNLYTGTNSDGSKNYLNMSFNPYTQAMDNLTNTGGQVMSGLNPLIKAGMDYFGNKQVGTGFDLNGASAPQGGQSGAESMLDNFPGIANYLGYYKDQATGTYKQNARAKTMLGDIIPQLNNLTAYIRAGEKDAQPLKYGDQNQEKNIFKNLFGLGQTSVNHETNKSFALQDLLRQQQQDLTKATDVTHSLYENTKSPDKITPAKVDKEWANEKQWFDNKATYLKAYQSGSWAPKRSSDGYIKDFFGNVIGFEPRTQKQYEEQLDASFKVQEGIKQYKADMEKLQNYINNGFPTRDEYYTHYAKYGVRKPN